MKACKIITLTSRLIWCTNVEVMRYSLMNCDAFARLFNRIHIKDVYDFLYVMPEKRKLMRHDLFWWSKTFSQRKVFLLPFGLGCVLRLPASDKKKI